MMTGAVGAGFMCACFIAAAVLVAPGRGRSERPLWGGQRQEPNEQLEMAYALELLALALAGGAPVATALSAVAEAEGSQAVSGVLSRVSAGLRWGLDDAQAWSVAPAAWKPAANAFALAGRAGAGPAELLRQAAQDVRAAESDRVAAAGAKAGVRIVLPLGLCFLPAFILLTVVPLVLGLIRFG